LRDILIVEGAMKPIQFETVVGTEQVIRPPAGIAIPEGVVDVTIQPRSLPTASDSNSAGSTRNWLLACARESEQASVELPSDMAEHHDHYAHGTPLP
jgi:hypothetical protein